MGNSQPEEAAGGGEVTTAIRVGLARKNATQSALGEHLRLSQAGIHRRMSGKVPWRLDELKEAAAFLGVGVAELVSPSDSQVRTEASA